MKHNINERTFQEIYKFLSTLPKIHIKNEQAIRIFLEAVYFLVYSGIPVRMLPDEYGNCFSIFQRFLYWKKLGIWEKLFKHLQDSDGEYYMIDSTIVRANQCSAGYHKNSQEKECLGRSVGGFSTKIHALCDALGNPVDFILTPGNNHDVTEAINLTKNLRNTKLIADKGYDSQDFIDFLKENNCEYVIPPRSNRTTPRDYDKFIYKARHLIENFFSKLKWFRRVFSRFDKTASSYISFVQFAASIILLR